MALFSAGINLCAAQTLPDFKLIKLNRTADYKPAEPFALLTANYLLSNPIVKDNPDRANAMEFIIKWMTGTPDHSFILDELITKLTKDNDDLLGIYAAAMVKYSLENKEASKDAKVVKLNALILMLNYCENKNNNIKMSKSLKKLSEAKQKGELEKAI